LYCAKCGTQNSENASFCKNCGASMSQTTTASIPTPIQTPISVPQPDNVQETKTDQHTSGLAIASLVLGILGISILAIIFGAIALNQMGQDPHISGKGLAIAGLILGIIGFAASLFAVAAFTIFTVAR
jgi:uncharacterized membrane protein YvbJ